MIVGNYRISNRTIILGLIVIGVLYYIYQNQIESFIGRNMNRGKLFAYPVQPVPQPRPVFGRPNKCFSCESDALNRLGRANVNLGFNTKCFSCEREAKMQGKDAYMEGSTKCFSCD